MVESNDRVPCPGKRTGEMTLSAIELVKSALVGSVNGQGPVFHLKSSVLEVAQEHDE